MSNSFQTGTPFSSPLSVSRVAKQCLSLGRLWCRQWFICVFLKYGQRSRILRTSSVSKHCIMGLLFPPDSFKCWGRRCKLCVIQVKYYKGFTAALADSSIGVSCDHRKYGHNGEYTPCAINKWIRPQKTNKNTGTQFLWAKTREEKITRDTPQHLLSKSPGDRLVRGHEGRGKICWCLHDFGVVSNYLRCSHRRHRSWVDKHAVAVRGLRAALWLVRWWNALDVSKLIFCPVNWCATMEYKTPGNIFRNQAWHTDTHFPKKWSCIASLQTSWVFSFQLLLLISFCFSVAEK